jgi:hypothetical protein
VGPWVSNRLLAGCHSTTGGTRQSPTSQGEEAGGEWCNHLLHVGCLEGEVEACVLEHCLAAGSRRSPRQGGHHLEGIRVHLGSR